MKKNLLLYHRIISLLLTQGKPFLFKRTILKRVYLEEVSESRSNDERGLQMGQTSQIRNFFKVPKALSLIAAFENPNFINSLMNSFWNSVLLPNIYTFSFFILWPITISFFRILFYSEKCLNDSIQFL